MKTIPLLLAAISISIPAALGELKLPAIIGDHMVLQQGQTDPIWGWDTAGTKVTVTFAGQTKSATAGPDGKWTLKLDPMPANATPQVMTIKGSSERALQDVLVGEVWMCSGQSNMQMALGGDWNGDIEALGADIPGLRLVTVPRVGTQEAQNDFQGQWAACTPENSPGFSAVGFYFGQHLHRVLGVPVGLINNAWGGSAAEAWVKRSSLEQDARFKELMKRTVEQETKLANAPEDPKAKRKPGAWLNGNARPGNIFNGVLHPTLGYGMKGVIWYQGESNASRAWEYGRLFPFMIEQWRKEWGQGNFPFYWVQLADFKPEKAQPGESDWAELRESQTKTLALPNTGQAVIIDLGEGRDIHPKNKQSVAARLVRWALAKDYGKPVLFRSPEFKSVRFEGAKAIVTLDLFGSKLRPFDVQEAIGFTVCGNDKIWHHAKGNIVGADQVEVTCEQVPAPIAVRYAWADNPVCNLATDQGLPVTPFRTDDFPMVTQPKEPVQP